MYLAVYFPRKVVGSEIIVIRGLISSLCQVHCINQTYFHPDSKSLIFELTSLLTSSESVSDKLMFEFFECLHNSFPQVYVSNICPFTTYRQFMYYDISFQLKQSL